MRIEILAREAEGTCELTRKSGIEVWVLRAGNGEKQTVSTQRLPEVLRVLSRVGNGQPRSGTPAPTTATSANVRKEAS